jgi:hypothetical protein
MSILTNPTETIEAKQAATRARILSIVRAIWMDLQIRQNDGMDEFWQNSQGLTPQQVADAFGPDCAKLFAFNSELVKFLQKQGEIGSATPTIRQPLNQFTVNQDGTVTISSDPYTP